MQSQALLGLGRLDQAQLAISEAMSELRDSAYGEHLIHYCYHCVLVRCGDEAGALAAISRAHECLEAILTTLSPQDAARSRADIPEHRAILAAWEAYRPRRQTVRLPRLDAPLGRQLTEDEEMEVTWIVETAADRRISSKTDRRHQQITRLLRQAAEQDASPAYHHLADALNVSERTIKRDMAALRKAGVDLPPSRR